MSNLFNVSNKTIVLIISNLLNALSTYGFVRDIHDFKYPKIHMSKSATYFSPKEPGLEQLNREQGYLESSKFLFIENPMYTHGLGDRVNSDSGTFAVHHTRHAPLIQWPSGFFIFSVLGDIPSVR